VYFFGSGGGAAVQHVSTGHDIHIQGPRQWAGSRRFLFQTAFPSGAAFPPFAPDALAARPLPDLATSLGRVEAEAPAVEAGAAVLVGAAFSVVLDCAPGAEALAVRNVLLTLMALKEAGFFTALFASSLVLEASDLAASLSDPPLILTSVEFTKSSTMSEMCLFSNSSAAEAGASPFTCGRLRSTSFESVSMLMVCGWRGVLRLATRHAREPREGKGREAHELGRRSQSSFIGSLLG
jgi:hypothetical protein